MSLRNTLARSALALLLTSVIACGGVFADTMKRGDEYAKAGMWDKAATEYEQAQKLEPGNTDVAIKLRQVRQKQSGERLARGKSLLARGEIEAGLAVVQEAVRLDGESSEAQTALTEANQQALKKAEELLSTPESRRAFDLTQLVLKGSPNDPRAKSVDGKVRDVLAEQSYERAEQFTAAGKRGNALMELAACATYRPAYRDAKLKIGELKAALQKELTFYVVLDRLGGAGPGEQDLSGRMKPELVGQAFDERLPLRVVAQLPAKDARGVRVSGAFSDYRFGPPQRKPKNGDCTWIDGYRNEPNPEKRDAEQRLNQAEQRLAQAEREVDQYQKEVDRHQKDVDDLQKDMARYESDAERAQSDYEKCQERSRPSSGSSSSSSSSCSSERSRLDSERSRVSSQRSRVQSAQSSLSSARDHVRSANDTKTRSRQEAEDNRRRLRELPEFIKVPNEKQLRYDITVHSLDAAVSVKLRAESLADKTTLLNDEVFPQALPTVVQESWLANPAQCPAQGKAAAMPTEDQVRGELVKKTIATLREKVQTLYEGYRTKFLTDARRLEANGTPEEAVESYVRYLLTGLKNIDPKDGKQIGEFLHKARGFGKIDLLGGL